MKLFLHQIAEIKNFGVKLVCLDEDGTSYMLDKAYTPYFYAVDLPKRYYNDIRPCTVEASPQTKPFIGFTMQPRTVVKMRTFKRRLLTWNQIHEVDTPIARQFCEESNLNPSCWFDSTTMQKCENQDDVPNFLLCSFDIECYSASGDFPVATNESDCITMICLSFQRLKGGAINSHILTLDAQSFTETDLIVENCEEEEILLQRFASVIKQYDPDILMGYNIDSFDMRYMHARLKDKVTFYKTLARFGTARFGDSTFSSAQKGSFTTGKFEIPGRTTLDLLPQVKAYNATLKYNKKLENCKLDTVCKQELGATKTDFSYQEIFRAHETKCPTANKLLVEYNVQDCVLVLQLQTKLQVILQLLQLSQISWTCIDDVIHRGQTCRVMNIVSKYAHDGGYYINSKQKKRGREEETTSFQGAHCFEPVVGIHEDFVLGLDFASLYPSVIRRYNIDPSTLVLVPTTHPTTKRQLSDGKDEYAEFAVDTPQAPIPRLLEELGKARTNVKKQMKTVAQGTLEYAVLNQRQLAIKVTMNSCYGFLGSSTGPIGHPELAAAVTAHGRDLVRQTAEYVLQTYPGAIIKGGDTDSVYCSLPIEKTLEASFREGTKISEAIGKMFGYPIQLEMEKVYNPMIYLKKKCYAAVMYENASDKGKLDVKGIALARGDSSALTKRLQEETISIVLQQPSTAWPLVLNLIQNAINVIRDMDPALLIKSKKLGAAYKFPERQVQYEVARRMKERGQDAPQVGERVYYLVGKGDGGVCKRADNPVNVTEIDYGYYVESQILKPMKRFLHVLCADWKNYIKK